MSESTVEPRGFTRLYIYQTVAKWFQELKGHAIYAPWVYNRLLEMEEWNGNAPFVYDYAQGVLRYTDPDGNEHSTSDRLRPEEGYVHPVVDGRGVALAICALLDLAPKPAHGAHTQVDMCRRAVDSAVAAALPPSSTGNEEMRYRSESDGEWHSF